jgi:leucyl-tRNA synthetase
LSPEHPLASIITTPAQRSAVDAYLARAASLSDVEKLQERAKTGAFTGAYTINPATGAPIPVWIADYVLMGYGSGAIMAVPAHDDRDHAFARAFGLPIVGIIDAPNGVDIQKDPWEGDGRLVNSGAWTGLEAPAAKTAAIAWLEEHGIGKGRMQYRLRDWLFSRQRYWGEPFPILHRSDGAIVPLPEDACHFWLRS